MQKISPATIHQKLCDTGISEQSAHHLIRQYTINYLYQKIDILEYLQSEEPHRLASPAGYLFKSIIENYTAPLGYQTLEQRSKKRKLKSQYQAKRKDNEHKEYIHEIALRLKKRMEKEELHCAAMLAQSISTQTEIHLRAFIEKNRPPNLRSSNSYNLKVPSIEKKKGDFGAGTIFEILRLQFFKTNYPQMLDTPTYRQVIKKHSEFTNISELDLEEALSLIPSDC